MPKRTFERIRDQAQASVAYQMDGLESGKLSVDDWQQGMAQDLVAYHLAAYLAGAGLQTADQIPDTAKGKLTEVLVDQVNYLNRFADVIDDLGTDDPALFPRYRARAAMYANGIRTSYSVGATQGLPLPAYPGQGSECRTNCGCAWRIEVRDADAGDYDCYWERSKDDSCPTCLWRESMWAPYRITGAPTP